LPYPNTAPAGQYRVGAQTAHAAGAVPDRQRPDQLSFGTQQPHVRPAGDPIGERGGQRARDSHIGRAPAAHQSSPAFKPVTDTQRRANMAVEKLLNSSLDSIRVRDGRKLGDVRFRELDALIGENTREAKILTRIKHHYRNINPDATVRSVIKISTLDKWLDEINEELRHVA